MNNSIPGLTTRADAKKLVALQMATMHGHLFPISTTYWVFRTFQRILSVQAAQDIQLRIAMENKSDEVGKWGDQ